MGQCLSCCGGGGYGPDGEAYRAGTSVRSPGPQTEADRAARAAAAEAAAARADRFDRSAVGRATKKSVAQAKAPAKDNARDSNMNDYIN